MPTLFEKIYGVEAAAAIANSMGDIPEGMSYQEIEAEFGFLDELLPQDREDRLRKAEWGPDFHYRAHHRPPGMTEDGMERHRLVTLAIIKKGGRIDIMDLANSWIENIDPEKFGFLLGPQDQRIYYALKDGIPPWEVGRFASWPSFIGTAKMMAAVGSINACDPEQAALDAYNLARIKDVRGVPGNYANEIAAGFAAGVAEAYRPGTSVDKIIKTVKSQLSQVPLKALEEALTKADDVSSWKELRPWFADKYKNIKTSDAVEVLTEALAILYLAKGNTEKCILWSVNFGRDTDCRAYVASTPAAAMHGIDSVPQKWVDIVNEELPDDPYTVSTLTTQESAEGIYKALMNEKNKKKKQLKELKKQID